MALHLIKLCVGVETVEDLRQWRESRGITQPVMHTRMTPKRVPEVLEGGSLYWVIKGVVLCRQTILDINTIGEGRAGRCEVSLDPEIVLTAPLARRPFQGWRYLIAKDAPADLSRADAGGLPDDLAVQLRDIGAW